MIRIIAACAVLLGLVAGAHADVLHALAAQVSGNYDAVINNPSEAMSDGSLSQHHLAAVMASRGTARENIG